MLEIYYRVRIRLAENAWREFMVLIRKNVQYGVYARKKHAYKVHILDIGNKVYWPGYKFIRHFKSFNNNYLIILPLPNYEYFGPS